jgi:hypothetical protein
MTPPAPDAWGPNPRRTGRAVARLAAAAGLALLAGCATMPARPFDYGPLACRDTTLDGADRFRALGPVIENRRATDGRGLFAVRPLYSREEQPEHDKTIAEVLWPLAVKKTIGREAFWRFGFAYVNNFDRTDPDSRYRFAAFPFLFAGKDSWGESYFGVFPLGGRIHEYLGLDRWSFVLLPLYSRSEVNDVVSHNVLWPFLKTARGGDVSGFHVFPFYGESVNRGAWRKRFILWPFWNSVRYEYRTDSGGGFLLWPLFGRVVTRQQRTFMALPPLFQWSVGRNGESKLTAPYPLVQVRRGAIRKTYLFPLFGRKITSRDRATFVLWPLMEWRETDRREYIVRRQRLLPFYYGETRHAAASPPTPAAVAPDPTPYARYVKVWPLFSRARDRERTDLQVPEIWPLTNYSSLRRNLLPFAVLYSRQTRGAARDEEALWGLYRYRRETDGRRRLHLFPLLALEWAADGRVESWRVLEVLGRRTRPPLPPPAPVVYSPPLDRPPNAGETRNPAP